MFQLSLVMRYISLWMSIWMLSLNHKPWNALCTFIFDLQALLRCVRIHCVTLDYIWILLWHHIYLTLYSLWLVQSHDPITLKMSTWGKYVYRSVSTDQPFHIITSYHEDQLVETKAVVIIHSISLRIYISIF